MINTLEFRAAVHYYFLATQLISESFREDSATVQKAAKSLSCRRGE